MRSRLERLADTSFLKTPRPPRPSLSLVRGPPVPHASRSGGGQTWRRLVGWWPTGWLVVRSSRLSRGGRLGVGCAVGVLLIVTVLQSVGTRPPRLRRCPPGLVGFLARNLASRFAFGTLMKLIADLEVPLRKTPTLKKPRERPTPGGSAEGAGGMSHALHDPQQEAHLWGAATSVSEARGACHTLCTTHNTPPCEPPTAQSTPGLPPSRTRSVRHRGAADER